MGFLIRWLDLAVVGAYLLGLTSLGLGFGREQGSTEQYFLARRSLSSWALAMSIVATLVTSVAFLAYPRAAYEGDWSLLVPGFLGVGVLALAGSVIIPFYRQAVGRSAYEYFGQRFGGGVRAYASVAFLLGQFSKMGLVFYLVAAAMQGMTGLKMDQVILIAGAMTVLYSLVGGLEAAVWTGAVQGFVLLASLLTTLALLLMASPGGAARVMALAEAHHKMRLGEWAAGFTQPNLLVLTIYGFFWFLQQYTADQGMVQRYVAAKSDGTAVRGVALGAVLSVPVWAMLLLMGTCVWAFTRLSGEGLGRHLAGADPVFGHFLRAHLPPGAGGLAMAALMGTAMCSLSSDLNSFALVGVEDILRRFRPEMEDRAQLRAGKATVLVTGAASIATSVALAHSKGSALSTWFTVSAIASGGLAGLFLLAFLTRRANRRGVWVGIAASLAFTAWATLTLNGRGTIDLGRLNFPWHDYMIGATAHVVLLVFGYAASLVLPERAARKITGMTLWQWRRWRRTQPVRDYAN